MQAYDSRGGTSTGYRAAQRFLAARLPGGRPAAESAPTLEQTTTSAETPRMVTENKVIEGTTLRAHRILDAPIAGFAAFLDGTQRSRVVQYLPGGQPLVHGTVAAVIRVRRNRRLVTWRTLVESRLYVPLAALDSGTVAALKAQFELEDLAAPDRSGAPVSRHPLALLERAVQLVQRSREEAERRLAEQWCGVETGNLFVDGGISGSERVATSACTVGVVKSHRTLYADESSLPTVLDLPKGHRTSVFRVTSPHRSTVASWYLRLRDFAGRDPMWGLVRVEAAELADATAMRARADEISRWVLAEASPIALPDGRWDKMAYGIRDCEEFLRAIS